MLELVSFVGGLAGLVSFMGQSAVNKVVGVINAGVATFWADCTKVSAIM